MVTVFFAQRAKALEERDRMTLEDIKDIRVALQEYYVAHQRFPEEIPPEIQLEQRFDYQCAELIGGACTKGFCTDEGVCTDYALQFTLAYGSGQYGKGEYAANKQSISLDTRPQKGL